MAVGHCMTIQHDEGFINKTISGLICEVLLALAGRGQQPPICNRDWSHDYASVTARMHMTLTEADTMKLRAALLRLQCNLVG